MPPLPWDKGDKGANTQKLFFEYSFVNLTHFSVKDVQFSIKLTTWPKGSPKGARRTAKGTPRVPQGEPKGAKGSEKGSKREPKGDTQGPVFNIFPT